MKITNVNLGIGIPLNFPFVYSAFFDTFVRMKKPESFHLIRSSLGSGVDELRNQIVERAQMIGATHLLMLDADMTYHEDTIMELLVQTQIYPVVSALCFRRYPPFEPLLFRGSVGKYEAITEWEKDRLIEVDATGGGCIMFNMEVFENTSMPWFEFGKTESGKPVGEDIGFCAKLKKAGYNIYVDPTVPCGHLSLFECNQHSWELFRKLDKRVLERLSGG